MLIENEKYILLYNSIQWFFGIIRISGGSKSKTTFSSFLQLVRMMSLYLQTKVLLRGANVDNEEKMELLTTYKEWLAHQF